MFREYLEKFKEKFLNSQEEKDKLIKVGCVILALLILLGFRIVSSRHDDIIVDVSDTAEKVIETNMYVDISGEVKNPGVYQFESGTRLYEVIEKAGGLTKHADKNGINQAEFVEDGQKIIIPTLSSGDISYSDDSTEDSYSANGLININMASKNELMEITGVGEVIADRIIEYRNNNRFKNIEEVKNVKGIGDATFEKMKSQITV